MHDTHSENAAITCLSSGDPYPLFALIGYPSGAIHSSVYDLSKYVKDVMLGATGKGQIIRGTLVSTNVNAYL